MTSNSVSEVLRDRLFLLLIIVGLAAVSVFELDQMLAQIFAQPEWSSFRQYCSQLTHVGEGAPYFALAFGLIIFSYAIRWSSPNGGWEPHAVWTRQWGLISLKALLLVGFALHVLKFTFGRQRPHLTEQFESLIFNPLNWHWHWQSFPSGHAQVSLLVTTFGAVLFPSYRVIFYSCGFAIAFTRVVIQQHFLSDILVGGLVGHLGALIILSGVRVEKSP